MNVAQPPPAGRIRWMPGQSLARVGRLARKELSEILRDRRTIITLVLMPLLLYPPARSVAGLGAEVLRLPSGPDHSGVNIELLLEELARRGIASVLVEGGKGMITSLLAARAVDRLVSVIAPKIIGEGTEAIGDLGITRLDDAITFSSVKTRKLGPDIVFDGRLK